MKILKALAATFGLIIASVAPAQDALESTGIAAHQGSRSILFVGNSFTQGERSAALHFRWDTVRDLTNSQIGGIPAIFKVLAQQAGQEWDVVHETRGGMDLDFHFKERRQLIAGSWDVVVLQQYSTLDRSRPGDPSTTMRDAPSLGRLFAESNPDVTVYLMATWSRADLVYRNRQSRWYGQPITAMAEDLEAMMEQVDASSDAIDDIIPVGGAWNRAMAMGIADPNPFDGIAFGQVSLWAYDQYHASAEGSYLEALVVFGKVTGLDPRMFGEKELAGHELGIDPRVVKQLQESAAAELGFQ